MNQQQQKIQPDIGDRRIVIGLQKTPENIWIVPWPFQLTKSRSVHQPDFPFNKSWSVSRMKENTPSYSKIWSPHISFFSDTTSYIQGVRNKILRNEWVDYVKLANLHKIYSQSNSKLFFIGHIVKCIRNKMEH